MTASILAIIAGLITLLIWWVRRYKTPDNDFIKQKRENAQAVAGKDPAVLNAVLDDRINRVRPHNTDPTR